MAGALLAAILRHISTININNKQRVNNTTTLAR